MKDRIARIAELCDRYADLTEKRNAVYRELESEEAALVDEMISAGQTMGEWDGLKAKLVPQTTLRTPRGKNSKLDLLFEWLRATDHADLITTREDVHWATEAAFWKEFEADGGQIPEFVERKSETRVDYLRTLKRPREYQNTQSNGES